MMPQDESTYGWWPASGEIDIYEGRGQNPTEVCRVLDTVLLAETLLSCNQRFTLVLITVRETTMTVLEVAVAT